MIIFTILVAAGGLTLAELVDSPVLSAIQDSLLWLVFFIVVAGAGIIVQLRANQAYELESYDRFAEYS